jgi:hypothetical protein
LELKDCNRDLLNDLDSLKELLKEAATECGAEVLGDHGIRPDAIFTDLDGATDRFIGMNRSGTVLVIHAHGDNIALLKYWVKRFTAPLSQQPRRPRSPMSTILAGSLTAIGQSSLPTNSVQNRSPSSALTLTTGTWIRSSGASSSGQKNSLP